MCKADVYTAVLILCLTVEGLLAGGTTSGRVGLWKYSPAPGITEPEDQWMSQTPSSVVGPVLEVEVCP